MFTGYFYVIADCPSMLECIRFRGRQRRINIPQEIGSNYFYFGLHLLNDPNGIRVRNIEHDYREIERINIEILQAWVTGRGKQPVTWETLTEVLRNIGLGTLASEIEAVKLVEVQLPLQTHSEGMCTVMTVLNILQLI